MARMFSQVYIRHSYAECALDERSFYMVIPYVAVYKCSEY